MKLKSKVLMLGMAIAGLIHANSSFGQVKADTVKKDTVKTVKPKKDPLKKIKPYHEVVNKNYKSQTGMFSVHRYRDTTYFELSNTIINRDILIVNRLASISSNSSNVFPGELLDEQMIRFELGRDSTIKIRLIELEMMANPNSNLARAVKDANIGTIIASFPIKAYSKDSTSYVLDFTKYLTEPGLFHSIEGPLNNFVSPVLKDVEIVMLRPFAENVEFTLRKNMTRKKPTSVTNQATIETYTSMLLLPKVPMRRRLIDDRIGYFPKTYQYFDDKQQSYRPIGFASRWRLEPKEIDMEKWKRGELVEPKKQIVIYIDPNTPKQWVPYLIKGIDDWQKAFEHAGFKNAIIGKEWPVNDPNMHIGDARYSMIHYFPSRTPNARGPHVADPRSGEVINTRIEWYHNVMDILDRWFKIQTAAVNPSARKPKLDDKTMGELIRTVSSHEVGHTLGLTHNFGASSFTPVEKLRDAKYLKENGHTVSIMDYARFNYVAQPEDKIPMEDLFPKIGAYDKWAIKWGYGYVGGKDEFEEDKIHRKLVSKKLETNPNVVYLDGERLFGDARAQTEDLGDDAIVASNYGIKNLKVVMANLVKWFAEDGQDFSKIAKYHEEIMQQFIRYMGHVSYNHIGFTRDPKVGGNSGTVYKPISRERHIAVVKFFDEQIFTTPKWLVNTEVENLIKDAVYDSRANPSHLDAIAKFQHMSLTTLIRSIHLHRILGNGLRFNTYTLEDHMQLMHEIIWRELKQPTIELDRYRRGLQRIYVDTYADIIKMVDINYLSTSTDVQLLVKLDMKALKQEVENAIDKADGINKEHLKDIVLRIDRAFDPKK
ncbi:zinc-dependent metalloprotease [Pedobacter sp. UBA4863]|uniref:zinc-dependent metalloprotease n=1 Tax=Pedobacter sp. UBA4863 TaxID=1947060 RepID=UPI0025E83D84|nr:zinc-dependent metalloprotease [Pedobacter sp. UBA4863]